MSNFGSKMRKVTLYKEIKNFPNKRIVKLDCGHTAVQDKSVIGSETFNDRARCYKCGSKEVLV